MEFKVGDKLRYVGKTNAQHINNKEYEVKEMYIEQVRVLDETGDDIGFWAEDVEKFFERIELQQPQITSEETTLEAGTRLRYKGALSVYELGGEYEIASTATLGGKKNYCIDNGVVGEDEWEHNELLEHFDVIDESLLEKNASEKIKLRPEVIKALENALKENEADDLINIHAYAIISGKAWTHDEAALNQLSVADLARALFIGYDVEQTVEEKLAKYYQKRKKWAQQALERDERHSYAINAAQMQAINTTLSLLNITVKGIND